MGFFCLFVFYIFETQVIFTFIYSSLPIFTLWFLLLLFSFFFLNIYLFVAVLGLLSVRELSPVAASGGHSSSLCAGLSLSRPLSLRSTGSRRAGSVIVAHGPAPRHVGFSQTRARTRVPCIGRQTLNYCATREALWFIFDL